MKSVRRKVDLCRQFQSLRIDIQERVRLKYETVYYVRGKTDPVITLIKTEIEHEIS